MKWIWEFIVTIVQIEVDVVSWMFFTALSSTCLLRIIPPLPRSYEKSFRGDKGEDCLVLVNCTDFFVAEQQSRTSLLQPQNQESRTPVWIINVYQEQKMCVDKWEPLVREISRHQHLLRLAGQPPGGRRNIEGWWWICWRSSSACEISKGLLQPQVDVINASAAQELAGENQQAVQWLGDYPSDIPPWYWHAQLHLPVHWCNLTAGHK